MSKRPNKITIVGTGDVGMSCAVGILARQLTCHLALIDEDEAKVIGETLDLLHASVYLNNPKILGGKDYAISSDSVLCIVTTSVEQQPDELEFDFLKRYVEVLNKIIPNLVKYSPNTIIAVVGYPIGILTFAAWKISRLPKHRVIGIASRLDTLTFRYRTAEKLGIAASNITGWAIDENILYSSLVVAGVKLTEIETSDLSRMNDPVAGERPKKIRENWAIALNCLEITESIIKNMNKIFSVAVCTRGLFGNTGDVFMPLPCSIGRNGIVDIVKLSLSDDEMLLLQLAVDKLERLNLKIALLQEFC